MLDDFTADVSKTWFWWQADPFSGKTAIVAWWVTAARESDVPVIACFLRRTARQDTADFVVRTWAEQLGALTGTTNLWELSQLNSDSQSIERLYELLEDAAQQSPIILVLDGLDEYSVSESVPVWTWLPSEKTLPRNVSLLLTSRSNAQRWVDSDHPIHNAVVRLVPSAFATEIFEDAKREIEHIVSDPDATLDRRILGFLAAADGPVAVSDMAALIRSAGTAVDASDIEAICRTRILRTVNFDLSEQSDMPKSLVFAHEQLRRATVDALASDLAERRASIHEFAQRFARSGWPPETPVYLLTAYPTMLIANYPDDPAVADQLVELVTDTRWQDRLRAQSGVDVGALSTIHATTRLLSDFSLGAGSVPEAWDYGTCNRTNPNLGAISKLIWHRDYLLNQSRHTPWSLPATWIRIGDLERAEGLARTVPNSAARARALIGMADALLMAGRAEEAHEVANDAVEMVIRHPDTEWVTRHHDPEADQVMDYAAEVFARLGLLDEARIALESITHPVVAAGAALGVVDNLIRFNYHREADEFAMQFAALIGEEQSEGGGPSERLIDVIGVLAMTNYVEEAKRLSAQYGDYFELATLPQIVASLVVTERAPIEPLLQRIFDLNASVVKMAVSTSIGGDADSRTFAHLTSANVSTLANLRLAPAAARVASEALPVFDGILDPGLRLDLLAQVSISLTTCGQREVATIFADLAASSMLEIGEMSDSLGGMTEGLARLAYAFSLLDRDESRSHQAAELAESSITCLTTRGGLRERLIPEIVSLLARARCYSVAESIARDDDSLLAALVEGQSSLGDLEEAMLTAARIVKHFEIRYSAMERLVSAMCRLGRVDTALDYASSIAGAEFRAGALATVAKTYANLSNYDAATAAALSSESAARSSRFEVTRDELGQLVTALAVSGQASLAEQFCGKSPDGHLVRLLELARVLASSEFPAKAEQVAQHVAQSEQDQIPFLKLVLTFVRIALAYHEADARADAERLIRLALECAAASPDPLHLGLGYSDAELGPTLKDLRSSGMGGWASDLALRIGSSIKADDSPRSVIALIEALCHADLIDEAETVARAVILYDARVRQILARDSDPRYKDPRFLETSLAKMFESERASIGDGDPSGVRAECLAILACHLSGSDDIRARRLAQEVVSEVAAVPFSRAKTACRLLVRLAGARLNDEALALSELLVDPNSRTEQLLLAAEEAALKFRFDDAAMFRDYCVRSFESLPVSEHTHAFQARILAVTASVNLHANDQGAESVALAAVAEALYTDNSATDGPVYETLVAAGLLTAAETLTTRMGAGRSHVSESRIMELAELHASRASVSEALRICALLPGSKRIDAMVRVAQSLSDTQIPLAIEVAEAACELLDEETPYPVTASVSRVLSNLGLYDKAEEIADRIPNLGYRIGALSFLSRRLLDRGETGLGSRIVVRIGGLRDWIAMTPFLPTLADSELQQCAELLLKLEIEVVDFRRDFSF